MKTLGLCLVLLAIGGTASAQDNDTCESLTTEGLQQFYDTYVTENKWDTATRYIHHFFYVGDRGKMSQFAKWADKKGYDTWEKDLAEFRSEPEKKDPYMIIIEKELNTPSLKEMSSDFIEIWEARKQFGIARCNGSGRGVGKMRFIPADK